MDVCITYKEFLARTVSTKVSGGDKVGRHSRPFANAPTLTLHISATLHVTYGTTLVRCCTPVDARSGQV